MRIVVSTGGTGGHIYPMLTVAEELKGMNHAILFSGGLYGPEKELAKKAGFEFFGVNIKGFDRKDLFKSLTALFLLPLAVLKAMKMLNTFRPNAVIGAGGYASAPTAIAAILKKIPLFLIEQNVYPGLVTRKLSLKARKVFTSFEKSAQWLKGANVVISGNPVRKGFSFGDNNRFSKGEKVLIVMGGSQGARSINNAVVEALPLIKDIGCTIYHQTGKLDFESVKSSYEKIFPSAHVQPYFENIAEIMSKGSLALCRAGASTCAELTLSGLPSILVPYPGAGGHQKLNALSLSDEGAAIYLDNAELSGESVSSKIRELITDAKKLELMSANARELAKPFAGETIARGICEALEGTWG
ncbi:MAG: undecaprenyldiphospho-muramoylpentapeptide beta-N-acetylglucosaminyltransferase [Nitrospinota bacterium]|nr:undecaprenyldiphospho-muramoylpentapeptide beta-N-acetylglucosaminyltransferase [Nitrospinota bacterium]